MSEYTIETRGRSRSKTPFLRSSCDHENCEHAYEEGHQHHHHHPKKKAAAAPNVHTIIEEAPTDKVQYRTTTTTTVTSASTKSNTGSLEDKIQQSNQTSKVSSESTTVVSSKSSRQTFGGISSSGPKSSSTPKASHNTMLQSFAAQYSSTGSGEIGSTSSTTRRRIKEVTQNETNSRFERSQQQQQQHREQEQQQQQQRSNRSNLSMLNGDLSDHPAYKEYKEAGEYWNKTPKTDYTYSELSPHRRELAPGVVAMPNMSRPGLKNHTGRVFEMIERNPAQEEFIKQRYFSQEEQNYLQNRRETQRLLYDSGDELDYARFERYGAERDARLHKSRFDQQQHTELSWFMRLITTITTSIYTVWSAVVGGDEKQQHQLYRGRGLSYAEPLGFFGTIRHSFLSTFSYLYLAISSVLYLDTWLLKSSNADSRGKKRFLLFLLILLPLLLLAAWRLFDDAERQYYLEKTQAWLPLPLLANWKSTCLSSVAAFQAFLYQIPVIIKNYAITETNDKAEEKAQINLHNMQLNLQKSGLTPEEYENILNHINSYVQKLVDIKLMEQLEAQKTQEITPAQTEVFVKVVRENLANLAREKRELEVEEATHFDINNLSDEQLELLAQRIQIKLEADANWRQRPVKLSAENLVEIQKLFNIQNQHFHTTVELVENLDLNALLARLIKSPQLANYVDARIEAAFVNTRLKVDNVEGSGGGGGSMTKAAIQAQQNLINELNNEVAFIKLALADKDAEHEDLQKSLARLSAEQQQHKLANDERFNRLWSEIQEKLATLHEKQFTLLNKQIKLNLIEILGYKATNVDDKFEDIDLQAWVRSIFVAKDYLEQRLAEMNEKTNERIQSEIDRSGALLMQQISARLKQEILISVEAKHLENSKTIKSEIHTALSESEVRKIVKSVLAIYDADKTGLVDFALESAGGQILSTRCTETFHTKSAQVSVFGIPLWYPSNTPRIAISPNVQPGECWAFQGFPGYLVLKLNSLVYVTGFTLEHIPRSLSPTGRVDSAPKNFTVWGLEHEKDQDPVLFGEYEYSDNDASLQYFAVQNQTIKRPYEIVELRIETNHGHPQYTCLYRFRVHGKPPAM